MKPIKKGPLPQAINPVRPRGMPSPLPRDVGTGAGPRGSVGGVKGPLPQAVDPVRPRGMPSPLPRDVGVGGGPRTAASPVDQQINAVRSGPRLSGPLGAAVSGINNAVNSGNPFKKPLPGGDTFKPTGNPVGFGQAMQNLSGLGQAVGNGMTAMNGNQAAQNAAASQASAPNPPAGPFKKGGKVKSKSSYSSGGGVKSSASKRGDGIAQRGKTKGRMV